MTTTAQPNPQTRTTHRMALTIWAAGRLHKNRRPREQNSVSGAMAVIPLAGSQACSGPMIR